MAQKVAIFNTKGGVGKSATATNLASGLSLFEKERVLLVDIDPQGTSAASLGISISNLEVQLKDVLFSDAVEERKALLQRAILATASGIDVLPSNLLLATEELALCDLPNREQRLKRSLALLEDDYDCMFIDCPPNIGIFALNALNASDGVIVPVDMSYVGLLGMTGVEYAFELIERQSGHSVRLIGVLATRYDSRKNISRDVLATLRERFKDKLFNTVIPDTVKVSEAPHYGISIFEHNPFGAGAVAYRALVDEVMTRW
ncbi:MAG: ParA family protein [Elainellaceae cyanobacterium]